MKKIGRAALCALGLAAALWLTVRYLLPIGLPFLLGWAASQAAQPAVRLLERSRLPRWLASFLCVSVVLALLGLLLWLLGKTLFAELSTLARRAPVFLASLSAPLAALRRRLLLLAAKLPEGLAEAAVQWLEHFFQGSSGLADSALQWLLRLVTGTLSSVPELALFLLTTLLSAYLFSAELPQLRAWLKRQIPPVWQQRARAMLSRLKSALGGYLKAQLRLMGVTFLIVAAGLLLLRQRHAIWLAVVIAAVDALPVFGVGTILIPWGAVALLRGETAAGIGILITYGAASLTRTLLEPRFLGRQIGLSPLLTLISMYAGFRLYGILGMILLPVAVILAKQVYTLLEPR